MPSLILWAAFAAMSVGVAYLAWRVIRALGGSTPAARAKAAKPVRVIREESGLASDILQEGSGRGARSMDKMAVHYTVRIQGEAREIDSSHRRGGPLRFKLGTRAVIPGWDKALVGMKVGERRILTVPASLAYGSKAQDSVPPGSTLVFDIELVELG